MPDARRLSVKEMALPFHFDATGGVAFETNIAKVYANHIKTVVMTAFNERAMRPTYGSPTRSYLFENADPALSQELAARVSDAVHRWEPAVVIEHVKPLRHEPNEGLIEIEIAFRVPPSTTVNRTTTQIIGGVSSTSSQALI